MNMDITRLKTAVVLIIIFGCFAVLYPRLFHPLFTSFLGANRGSTVVDNDYDRSTSRHPVHNDIKRKGSESQSQIRMTGHPGMHALSEMKKYSVQKQGSGGKGILGIVLPLYALGIVAYLIYTLSKLLFRKKNNESKTNLSFSEIYSENMPESNMKDTVLRKQKDLEKLLWKADQEDIGDDEIDLLKKRLVETEHQMTRILKAMDDIQKTMSFANYTGHSQDENDISCGEVMNKEEKHCTPLEISMLRKRYKS